MRNQELQKAFSQLLTTNATLTTSVYNFVLWMQGRDKIEQPEDSEEDEGKEKKRKRKDKDGNYQDKKQKSVLSSINRESKSVPNLVYSVEMYEKRLVELGRKVSGGLDLTSLVKRAVARDFKATNKR